jgi:hypothetical protein
MKKWATKLNRTFLKKKAKWPKKKKKHEKILTTPGHKGNVNQIYTKISPHSC